MRLTDAQIIRYQEIYHATFGEELSKDDALMQGMALLRLVKVLTNQPNDKKEYEYETIPGTNN